MKLFRLLLASLFVVMSLSSLQAQFDPSHKGYYLLKTKERGDAEALEGNEDSGNYKNGAAFMSTQKGANGQRWKVEETGPGHGIYYLKTQYRGDNECLHVNSLDYGNRADAVFMYKCIKDSWMQTWQIEAAGNGYYRLKGRGTCLEGNHDKGKERNGGAYVTQCKDAPGQLWKFERVQ